MQNYLAVLFISNNSVHERYDTNLLTCEYLVWTDTYSAHQATVSAGQNRTSTSTSTGFIRHKYTKAKQKHAYYIVMSGDSY